MTTPPLPTFVPQDAWYKLTPGDINPSIADSVPVGADLLPKTDANNITEDGIVGSLDGGVIFLAGSSSQLDGGQAWVMWQANSLAVSDGMNVFCPFVNASKPGRWVVTQVRSSGPGVIVASQTFPAGVAGAIASIGQAQICYVYVKGRSANAVTPLTLPATVSTNQIFSVKDAQGDAGTYNITISPAAGTIDGDASVTIGANYGEISFIWNGTEWSVA